MSSIRILAVGIASLALMLAGCTGDSTEGTGDETTLSIERIEEVKSQIHQIRRGASRDEVWNQLKPMLGTSSLPLMDDSSPASHATQSYRMGHGYILRVMYDPNNPDVFRRAEIVKR